MPAKTTDEIAALVNSRWPGAMQRASAPEFVIQRLPTGVLSLDLALNGGIARGRHTEFYGSFSTGKTYVALRTIARTQADGGRCAFVNSEGSFDAEHAARVGVDLDTLDMPDRHYNANRLFDIVETLLRTEAYSLVVVDSIASLLPKREEEAELDKSNMGTALALLMSQALRKLTTANRSTALIFINQQRENIGSLFQSMTTPGGRAMGFYAGDRIEMTKSETLKAPRKIIDPKTGADQEVDRPYGHRVLVRIDKSKTGIQPLTTTSFVFDYRLGGIDPVEDLMYCGRLTGLVHKDGTKWWVEGYKDETQNGRTRFRNWLRRNVAVGEELEAAIRTKASSLDEDPNGIVREET